MSLFDLQSTVIPFGKHKGQTFDEVPLAYLDWLIGQEWLNNPLKGKLQEYLNHPTIQRTLEQELEGNG